MNNSIYSQPFGYPYGYPIPTQQDSTPTDKDYASNPKRMSINLNGCNLPLFVNKVDFIESIIFYEQSVTIRSFKSERCRQDIRSIDPKKSSSEWNTIKKNALESDDYAIVFESKYNKTVVYSKTVDAGGKEITNLYTDTVLTEALGEKAYISNVEGYIIDKDDPGKSIEHKCLINALKMEIRSFCHAPCMYPDTDICISNGYK